MFLREGFHNIQTDTQVCSSPRLDHKFHWWSIFRLAIVLEKTYLSWPSFAYMAVLQWNTTTKSLRRRSQDPVILTPSICFLIWVTVLGQDAWWQACTVLSWAWVRTEFIDNIHLLVVRITTIPLCFSSKRWWVVGKAYKVQNLCQSRSLYKGCLHKEPSTWESTLSSERPLI